MVMGRLSDPKKEVRKIVGIDCISGLPREEIISSYVVNDGIMNCLNEIAAEMKHFWSEFLPDFLPYCETGDLHNRRQYQTSLY